MKKFFKRIWAKFLTVFGDIKCFSWPLWLVYDPNDFQMTGHDTLEVMAILEPGDVVLRGYNKYLDGKFIAMFGDDTANTQIGAGWSHGSIYIGQNKIIHAVAEGVSEVDVVEFTRCDRICIFRPRCFQKSAIKAAKKFLAENVPYDFNFKHGASALYCFELAALCYQKLSIPTYNIKKMLGLVKKSNVYLAKSFLESKDFELVYCNNPRSSISFCKR